MPDTLRITFFGLGTFVPVGDRTHVLFPPTVHEGHEGHEGHSGPVPPHEVRLFLGEAKFGSATQPPTDVRLDGAIACIGNGGATKTPVIPETVFDLGTMTGGAPVVAAAFKTPIDPSILNARLELTVDGDFTVTETAKYDLKDRDQTVDGGRVTMASFLIWNGPLPADLRTITVHRPDKTETYNLPAANGGFVDLTVCHLPRPEQPPKSPPPSQAGEPVDHFAAYYELFAQRPDPALLPFVPPNGGAEAGHTGCMVSRADPPEGV